MWVNSCWQTGDFTQADKPLLHSKNTITDTAQQDTNPLQMTITTFSSENQFPIPCLCVWGRSSSTPTKTVSKHTFESYIHESSLEIINVIFEN